MMRRARVVAVIVLVAVACVVFLVVLPYFFPATSFLDPDLPPLFLNHFWTWILVFVLGIIVSVVFLVRTVLATRPRRAEATPAELAGRFPELEAAWEEIQVKLHQAQVDPAGGNPVMVAPGGEVAHLRRWVGTADPPGR